MLIGIERAIFFLVLRLDCGQRSLFWVLLYEQHIIGFKIPHIILLLTSSATNRIKRNSTEAIQF